ncbi:Protein of unknown function DUF4326) [uncultured Caudovirales phage]|uniref:DUF4326 domain-containing protein n=1 Tax=uncultured Caudovirales phage TaxID=2100421 RepID=A0A6J5PA36_9CAUD|nr:Protein of unknown function DUF4326) [uncultured Caudovirales phage]
MTNTVLPHRVQRKRTKGWKMPDNTVYVGRPTRWGNPCRCEETPNGKLDHAESVRMFKALPINKSVVKQELRGKNLACWCPLDKPCHADVLLEIANG